RRILHLDLGKVERHALLREAAALVTAGGDRGNIDLGQLVGQVFLRLLAGAAHRHVGVGKVLAGGAGDEQIGRRSIDDFGEVHVLHVGAAAARTKVGAAGAGVGDAEAEGADVDLVFMLVVLGLALHAVDFEEIVFLGHFKSPWGFCCQSSRVRPVRATSPVDGCLRSAKASWTACFRNANYFFSSRMLETRLMPMSMPSSWKCGRRCTAAE